MFYLILAAVIILGYLLGNINFALIISKLNKRDIRKSDSGNPGAMNMFRNFGSKLGALTLVLDAFKGAAAAVLGWFLLGSNFGAAALSQEAFGFGSNAVSAGGFFEFSGNHIGMFIGGVSAIVGHVFPVFLKFKGGKGIATTIGVCLVISPIAAVIGSVAGFIFISFSKMGAVTSFVIITPPLAYAGYTWSSSSGLSSTIIPLIVLFIFLLTLFRHRSNVRKLFIGTEKKTNIFKKKKKQ